MFLKTLRPYQREAVGRAILHDGFALFCEQRTGKTPMAAKLIDMRQPDRLLVFTLEKGIVVWEKEFRESLRFDWPCEVRILNYDKLRNAKLRRQLYRWLDGSTNAMVISDESHRIKRRGSKQSRTVRNCGKRARYRLALTGTPIAQGRHDAWAQFDFINPRAFGPWKRFAKKYLKMHGHWTSKVIGYKNKPLFDKIFHRYSFRVTLREARAEAGLPGLKVRRRIVRVNLDPNARDVYHQLDKEMYAIVWDKRNRKTIDTVTAGLVITQAMKMQQVAGGFVISDSGKVRPVGREKLRALERICRDLSGERYIVVARFLHEIRAIRRLLERLGRTVQVIAGGTKFTGQLDAEVGILQIQSGAAIDLAAANSIIFFSWDYSYINLEQTKFRILSFDTDRVNYWWIRVRDSIDELLYQAVTKKEDLARLVCDAYRRRGR
jgi:hypothetical protein